MRKKFLSMLLAIALVVTMVIPAMASSTTTPNVTTPGSVQTELKGTIAATKVNVTVPTSIAFTMDPTIEVSTDKDVTGQITPPPGDIEIINESLVPVYVKISSVTVTGGVDLVQTEADLMNDEKAVMLGYKAKGEIKDFDTATDWLEVKSDGDNYSYYLKGTDGKLEGMTLSGGTPEPGVMTMQICGQAKYGWRAGDSFTVTPTIVVSTTDPTAA